MTLDPTLEQRMARLVREVAGRHVHSDLTDEARAIARLLPDPDLKAARKIAADVFEHAGQIADARNARKGQCDNWSTVKAALIAIRYGRENGRVG